MHHQHIGAGVNLRNVNKVRVGVVLGLGIQSMGHGVLSHAGHHDRVTVRCCLESALGTDHAAGATDVFDHKGLFEDLAEFFGGHATHDVAGTTWRKRHDELDRLGRVVGLGQYGQWQCGGQGCNGRQADEGSAFHGFVSFVVKIKTFACKNTGLCLQQDLVCQSAQAGFITCRLQQPTRVAQRK